MDQPSGEARRLLAESRHTSGLPRELIDRMLPSMSALSFAPGATIIAQADPGDALLLVMEGSAAVRVRDDAGVEHAVGHVGRGDVIGEMALVTGARRSADVVATTPVRALALPATAFHELARRYPEFAMILSKLIAERLGGMGPDILGDKVLEGYRIRRSVGQGAMAVVYEAEAVETGQRVALKMMSHRLVYRASALTRFREEADICATLAHENIARLYSRFSAYGTHFLVLEYVDGPGLDSMVDHRGGLDEATVRAVVGQLCRALQYVHSRNLIHRDIKASNVRLTRQGVAKLMDFGLSRPALRLGDRTETHEMRLIGTPVYMAPEQFEEGELDRRIDIYGLGCTTYRMLTGQRPFTGGGLAGLLRQKATFEIPPRDAFDPPIGAELREFLVRSMEPDRDRRLTRLDEYAAWAAPVDPALCAP